MVYVDGWRGSIFPANIIIVINLENSDKKECERERGKKCSQISTFNLSDKFRLVSSTLWYPPFSPLQTFYYIVITWFDGELLRGVEINVVWFFKVFFSLARGTRPRIIVQLNEKLMEERSFQKECCSSSCKILRWKSFLH